MPKGILEDLLFLKKYQIKKGISVMKWNNFEDGIILKMDKYFFGFERDIFLFCIYILPENSSRNCINTDIETFES